MVSIFEGILKPIRGLLKLLNSPLIIVIVLMVGVLGIIAFVLYNSLRPQKKVLYISEAEGKGDEMNVNRMTPSFLYSKKKKDPYRFIRYRDAINFEINSRVVTRWLAKKGTAFTKKLEKGEVGEFTLYKIMIAVWGQEVIDALKDEQKQKLIESEVMLTVRLEEGLTPDDFKDNITEIQIKAEEDAEQAKSFGQNVRHGMFKEDWIRTAAIFVSGIGACYILQAMGILGGVS